MKLMNKIYCACVLLLILLSSPAVGKPPISISITITGVEGDAKNNIYHLLNSKSAQLTSRAEVLHFYADIFQNTKEALKPYGYFKPVITSSLNQQNHQWQIGLHISTGAAVTISAVNLEIYGTGKYDPTFQAIIASTPLHVGQPFTVPDYDNLKRSLQDAALAKGYFDAKILLNSLTINLFNNTAQITIHFDTGIRYRFGKIFFNTNLYSSDFLRRFAKFKPGDYYSVEKIQDFQEALSTSDYFKHVSIDPQVDNAVDGLVPISTQLMAKPSNQYDFGLGYGTDTGIRGLIDYEARHLSPDGQRFKALIQASQIITRLQMDYTIPGQHPETDKYIMGAAIQQENINVGSSTYEQIAASYVGSFEGLQQIISLALHQEHWELNNTLPHSQLLLVPSINWLKVYKDNDIHPSKGYRFNISLLGTPDFFKNTPFAQARFNSKAIFPVFNTDRVIGRLDLGYTITQDIDNLPLSYQLLAGGAQNLRGFQYNSIGPGRNMFVGSIEYRKHIKDDWYLAGFYDTGNVSNTFSKPT